MLGETRRPKDSVSGQTGFDRKILLVLTVSVEDVVDEEGVTGKVEPYTDFFVSTGNDRSLT